MNAFIKILVCLLLLSIPVGASAITVTWMGINWNDPYGSIAVNGVTGYLEVTTTAFTTSSWGAAHYNTPGSFRAAATPWVEVSFLDTGDDSPGPQLWMEDETYNSNYGLNTGTLGAWTQFGAWERSDPDYDKYRIYWWDYDTANDGWVNTSIARTATEHTIKLGMRADGTVDYYFDGALVHSTTNITPNYFGDIYLAGHSAVSNPGATVIFTNYQTGTDYTVIPEPSTILLLVTGFIGLGLFSWFRRRKS